MKLFNSFAKWVLLPLFILISLNSCKKDNTPSSNVVNNNEVNNDEYEDEVTHAKMQYFDFDTVENLTLFFDSLRNKHGIPVRDINGDEESTIFDCIEAIEQFRDKQSLYYPDTKVKHCIRLLSFECGYLANHIVEFDMAFAEWFLMLAAFYSPDITYLVHMQTPNHCAGIHNFGSAYNDSPWWSYIFLKRSKGFEVRRLGEDNVKINKIFQIVDEKNRLYYLCSNNESRVEFLQFLFLVEDDEHISLVAECNQLPIDEDTEFEECYYNPDQHAWYCCNRDNSSGKLIPISEHPVLTLKLDGKKSCFHVE